MPYPDQHRPDPSSARPAKARKQIAVALQYELDGPTLPRVVASGQGRMAEKILEMAFASGVKVREDADLAELLSVVQLDSEIPTEALVAVAEILAYIYRANGKLPPLGGHSAQGGTPMNGPALLDMAAIERELDMIALAIGDTRAALQGGGVIDLAGLDDRVAAICAGLETQPHEAGRALLPKLTLLVQDLNMLSAACAQVRADTEQALRRMSGSRASQAYGKPSLSPIPGPVRD